MLRMLTGILLVAALVVFSAGTAEVHAQQVSQEQLEQLRQLPRAQQERLARQYGVDLSRLDQMDRREQQEQQEPETIFMRGTEFDRDGNPILPDDILRQFQDEEDVLKPFGYELFAGQPSTFTPLRNVSVPADYVLGVGDSLTVHLFGQETQQHMVRINPEGNVIIPQLGVINIAGMRYSEAVELIRSRVNERMIGFEAAVSMGELRSVQIFLTGESFRPGAYTVNALTTISQALVLSGGVSDIASLRGVQLRRAGQVVAELDLYDFLLKGETKDDIRVKPGDVIFIPARGPMVSIEGEIARPAIYELKGEETLADLIEYAGGESPDAFLKSIHVQRIRNGQRVIESVDAHDDRGASYALRGGDRVNIPVVGEQLDNDIMLIGAVTRSGHYEWKPGIRVSDIIRSARHDLLEQADLGYALIVREEGSRRHVSTLQFDIGLALEGDERHNLELEPRDQVLVFSRFELKENERNSISRLTLTQQERQKEEREKLFDEFRMRYLRSVTESAEDRARRARELESRAELQGLFGREMQEDEIDEAEYSEFSRHRMLAPVIDRMRDQGVTVGQTPLVSVSGEVRHPGIYPLPRNARVSDLVAAAGGLLDSAYLARAEVARIEREGDRLQHNFIPVNLEQALMSDAKGEVSKENFRIASRDRLNVLSIPDWQNTYEVEVGGEVRFPGTYSVRRGESLQNLIERAGGLTDFAFAEGAVFTRDELREAEQRRLESLAQDLQREIASNVITDTGSTGVTYQETRVLLRDLVSAQALGRMVIDLPAILAGDSQMQDVSLRDGDRIVIPPRHDSVSVMGEVQQATAHRYNPNLSVADYLARSGGVKQKADNDRIYVIRANGAVEPYRPTRGWFSQSRSTQLRPGDTIVVPLDSGYRTNMELWVNSTQIIYQLAVAAAAIGRI